MQVAEIDVGGSECPVAGVVESEAKVIDMGLAPFGDLLAKALG